MVVVSPDSITEGGTGRTRKLATLRRCVIAAVFVIALSGIFLSVSFTHQLITVPILEPEFTTPTFTSKTLKETNDDASSQQPLALMTSQSLQDQHCTHDKSTKNSSVSGSEASSIIGQPCSTEATLVRNESAMYNLESIGDSKSSGGKLYLCGWIESVPQVQRLFPNHTYVPLTPTTGPPTDHLKTDILISNQYPEPACKGVWKDTNEFYQWVVQFPGKVLIRNGEPYEVWKGPLTKNVYRIGFYEDSNQFQTMRWRFLQTVLLEIGPDWWVKLFDQRHRPTSRRERFLIYAASNCVRYRERAAGRLSEIGVVDYGGRCRGFQRNATGFRKATGITPRIQYFDNKESFTTYRFCLVMENSSTDGYMTEKILNAFLAGCVPIWYGTREVFDIFNKDAFIFYDIHDPEPALARVRELEFNESAYDAIMRQPILANGSLEEYFSFTTEIGGGKLQKKLHEFMGI